MLTKLEASKHGPYIAGYRLAWKEEFQMLENIIVFSIIALMVVGAIVKIIIDKKNGVRCSGCPHSKTCSNKDACGS